MAKGISLHIGLNFVDPRHYQGWNGELNACIADARDMRKLAKKKGFAENAMLLDGQATAAAVTSAIESAAKKLSRGDIFFLTYSGHGGQVRDTNGDEKNTDRMDETWVLFDRQLVDDEIYRLWSKFKAGVRILALSDSCHSGTVTRDIPVFLGAGARPRAMPRPVGVAVENANRELYRSIQKTTTGAERVKVKASVLLISGCMDNQTSMDGDDNGAFTGMLKKVWNGGRFSGNYRKLRDRIVAQMPATQTPNYFFVGAGNAAFEAQKPFTI